jgi:hypothetical protein
VIVSYSPHERAVHTHWSGDHAQNLAAGSPLLVMDMYDHACDKAWVDRVR